MPETIYYHGTREELKDFIRQVPRSMATNSDDLINGLKLRIANAVLSEIQQDFETKSRGGTGRDGIKWVPLKKETIAGREPPNHKKRGERPMGLLTKSQDELWRRTFAKVYGRLAWQWDHARAAAGAAKAAWTVVKAAGGKTRLETLGNRQVDILRDKGLLFRSFTAGIGETESNAEGQVIRMPVGGIAVGSNVKPWHHTGIPGKLPARPFWPPDGSIPGAWWVGIRLAAARGLKRMVQLMAQRGH